MVNPIELALSLVPHALGLTALAWVIIFGFRAVRALSLGSAWEELEGSTSAPVWVPSELEVSASRLRRARRLRREAEIASWEASFSALVVARGGCPVCAGRSHNH